MIQSPRILITGASHGIGLAIARRWAARDASLVLISSPEDYEALAGIAEDLRHSTQQSRAHIRAVDLRDPACAASIVSDAAGQLGGLDHLMLCAGANVRPGDWRTVQPDAAQSMYQLHVVSNLQLIRSAVPHLDGHASSVVCITSTTAGYGPVGAIAYAASKAGLIPLVRGLARELGPQGIRVNAVSPGHIATRMTAGAPPAVTEAAVASTPLARLGDPDEIAHAALFLCDASFVTGHVLVVDRGHSLT